MSGNMILGFVMLVVCVAIQCFVISVLLRVLAILRARNVIRPTLGATTLVLAAVMLILVAGNVGQSALWAVLFVAIGEFQDFATAFYFSVVNFTTLGYGDIVMSEPRRLLGALEAANGVLMLGLTTSVVFLVLHTVLQRAWNARFGENL